MRVGFAKSHFLLTTALILIASTITVSQTTTIAFQGNEGTAADNWGFTTSGASAAVLGYAGLTGNKVSGAKSIAVGGNVTGTPGNCIANTGSGNGTPVAHNVTFNPLDISSSNSITRTLTFSYGNYQNIPNCGPTGWDTGENLVFTPFHDFIAQTPITLKTGFSNLAVDIASTICTYTIPSGVNTFSFTLSISTNRNDELLFVDDVRITIPGPLSSTISYFYVSNSASSAKIHWRIEQKNEMDSVQLEFSLDGNEFQSLAYFYDSDTQQVYPKDNSAFLVEGFYRLKLLNKSGQSTYSRIVKVNTTSKNDILLYPSPANEYVVVETTHGFLDFEFLKLYDVTGKQVSPKWEGNKIDLNELTSGIYFLSAILNNETKILRFIKE